MNYTEFCSGFANTTVTCGSGNWQLAWLLNNTIDTRLEVVVLALEKLTDIAQQIKYKMELEARKP